MNLGVTFEEKMKAKGSLCWNGRLSQYQAFYLAVHFISQKLKMAPTEPADDAISQ